MTSAYSLTWLPEAKADLSRLYDFIAYHNISAAARAVDAILEAVDHLTYNPNIGRFWEHDEKFREIIVQFGARGYVVRYRIIKDVVVIARLWHGLESRSD